jgi:hexosaminidase
MSLPVIPRPYTFRTGPIGFAIDSSTPVVVADPSLHGVAQRFVADLAIDTGLSLDVVQEATQPAILLILGSHDLTALPATAGRRADGRSGVDADERHAVSVDSSGVRVWGPTPEAVHRALTTLRQLVIAAVRDDVAELANVRISDTPRFAWRGLSLDVARTFHDVETVRRVIDMCALYKLNVLHLHLTDDQGWRLEVPAWPQLTEVGGRGALGDRLGGYYSMADVADLVAYARERFVTLVPEVDMPGHTAAVFASYPELGSGTPDAPAPDAQPGLPMPAGALDPERDITWRFVGDVIAAAVEQFPQSAYVHIGADEAFGMSDEAHAAFVERAIATVKSHGRRAIGWQEAARAGVGADEVVQYWMEPNEIAAFADSDAVRAMVPEAFLPVLLETLAKSATDVPDALRKGAAVLVSPTTRVYFDRPHAAVSTDPGQETRRARVGLPVYPPTSLRDGVEWDPIDETPGVDSEEQMVGVEAALWCETVTSREDLEFMLLPRLAGAAEKAWAPREATTWPDYLSRLRPHAHGWDRRGWAWFRSSEVDWPAAIPALALSSARA